LYKFFTYSLLSCGRRVLTDHCKCLYPFGLSTDISQEQTVVYPKRNRKSRLYKICIYLLYCLSRLRS